MFWRERRWLYPVLLVCIIAPFTPYLDLAFSDYFYQKYSGFADKNKDLSLLFRLGEVPAQITGLIALIVLTISYIKKSFLRYRIPALFLTLVFLIGPGLIVNFTLKDHWGRARPRQIERYGGDASFTPFYQPNFGTHIPPQKSFPSGHVSMGFYFFALARMGKRIDSNILHYGGYAIAWILGLSLCYARMAQGGHFFSDTLMSAIIMWWVTLSVEWFLYERSH